MQQQAREHRAGYQEQMHAWRHVCMRACMETRMHACMRVRHPCRFLGIKRGHRKCADARACRPQRFDRRAVRHAYRQARIISQETWSLYWIHDAQSGLLIEHESKQFALQHDNNAQAIEKARSAFRFNRVDDDIRGDGEALALTCAQSRWLRACHHRAVTRLGEEQWPLCYLITRTTYSRDSG